MRKLLYLISIIFLSNTFSIAQNSKTIDKAVFDNLIDYVNCKYTNQYIQKIEKNNNDTKAYDEKIKPELDRSSLNKHLSNDDLHKLLKDNSWGTTANNLVKTWKDNKKVFDVSGKSNSEIIDYIVKIEGTFKTTIGDDFISEIRNELLEKYPNVVDPPTSVTNTNLGSKEKKEITKEVVDPNTDTHSDFSLWIFVISEAIFIIILLILFIKQKKSLKGEMQSLKSEIQGEINREYIIKQVLSSNRIANKFKQKTGKLGSQTSTNSYSYDEKIIDTIVNKVLECISSNGNENPPKGKTVSIVTSETPEMPESTVKYLKEKEGMILFKEATKENAYYELFNIQGNKASYRFCGNEDRAMANYDAVLKDVFDDEKSYSSKAVHITNGKEGIVELLDDARWKIKTPAKIKFI